MSEKMERTYWNGEPCAARRVRVIVGKAEKPTFWYTGMEGSERRAVQITYEGQTTYIDNEDGSGWRKVTEGRGSPWCSHKSLSVKKVVQETGISHD